MGRTGTLINDLVSHHNANVSHLKIAKGRGRLGGSVGSASDLGSGRDLTVRGLDPHVQLSGVEDPASVPLSLSLAASLPLMLSLKNK